MRLSIRLRYAVSVNFELTFNSSNLHKTFRKNVRLQKNLFTFVSHRLKCNQWKRIFTSTINTITHLHVDLFASIFSINAFHFQFEFQIYSIVVLFSLHTLTVRIAEEKKKIKLSWFHIHTHTHVTHMCNKMNVILYE